MIALRLEQCAFFLIEKISKLPDIRSVGCDRKRAEALLDF